MLKFKLERILCRRHEKQMVDADVIEDVVDVVGFASP
jgi:hypothetical protein